MILENIKWVVPFIRSKKEIKRIIQKKFKTLYTEIVGKDAFRFANTTCVTKGEL